MSFSAISVHVGLSLRQAKASIITRLPCYSLNNQLKEGISLQMAPSKRSDVDLDQIWVTHIFLSQSRWSGIVECSHLWSQGEGQFPKEELEHYYQNGEKVMGKMLRGHFL